MRFRVLLPGGLRGTGGPGDDPEIVRIVAQKRHARRDGRERIVAQGRGGIGQGAALAGAFAEQIVHVAGRARGHETHRLHAVHERAPVVIPVLVAELESEPVPIGVGEVHVQSVTPLVGGRTVDILAPVRQVELGKVAVVGPRAAYIIADGIIAVEVHQHRMRLAVLGFQIISAHSDGLPGRTVRNRRDLHQVNLAFRGTLAGDFNKIGLQLDAFQLLLGIVPEAVEVRLFVRGGNKPLWRYAEAENAGGAAFHIAASLVEPGFQFLGNGHVDVQGPAGRHLHLPGEGSHLFAGIPGDTDLGLRLHRHLVRILRVNDEGGLAGINPVVLWNRNGEFEVFQFGRVHDGFIHGLRDGLPASCQDGRRKRDGRPE